MSDDALLQLTNDYVDLKARLQATQRKLAKLTEHVNEVLVPLMKEFPNADWSIDSMYNITGLFGPTYGFMIYVPKADNYVLLPVVDNVCIPLKEITGEFPTIHALIEALHGFSEMMPGLLTEELLEKHRKMAGLVSIAGHFLQFMRKK